MSLNIFHFLNCGHGNSFEIDFVNPIYLISQDLVSRVIYLVWTLRLMFRA